MDRPGFYPPLFLVAVRAIVVVLKIDLILLVGLLNLLVVLLRIPVFFILFLVVGLIYFLTIPALHAHLLLAQRQPSLTYTNHKLRQRRHFANLYALVSAHSSGESQAE